MSVSGINGLPFPTGWPTGAGRVAGEREAHAGEGVDGAGRQAEAASTPAQTHDAAAPEGVDQAFWSVLTAEERAHFDRLGGMGGLTYAPSAGRGAAPARGGRIDVRA